MEFWISSHKEKFYVILMFSVPFLPPNFTSQALLTSIMLSEYSEISKCVHNNRNANKVSVRQLWTNGQFSKSSKILLQIAVEKMA